MNVINVNLELIHYIDSDGEVIVEVYVPGVADPILSSSVSVFDTVRELTEILANGEDSIRGATEEAEAAYELVDELQDCIDYLNDHIGDITND